jgi:uncharacterized membrane protein required for colicin V production
VTRIDWIVLGFVGLTALGGYRRGLVGTALSLIGLALGAVVGARVAPEFLSAGSHSRYTALVGLVGAFVGVGAFQLVAAILARTIRGGLRLLPPLRLLDSLGGLAVGVVWGLALVWVAGAVALQIPGQPKIRQDVKRSKVVHRLDRIAPPHDLLLVQKKLVSLTSLLDR